jgi:hydroxypyruvate reductase
MTSGDAQLVVQVAPLPVEPGYQAPVAVTPVRLWEQPDPDAWWRENSDAIHVLVTHSGWPVDAATMDGLPHVGLIANFGVGLDLIDTAAATDRGIRITHTPDMLTNDVADLAIALTLAGLRNMASGHRQVASGEWPGKAAPLGQSARGKRLGIFGLGRIGREVARLGEALGMEIAYVSQSPKSGLSYANFSSCCELAQWSDVLILCAAGSEQTRNIVDADVLAALGHKGILVNVARGSLIDEDALASALSTGQILAAGLDVFQPGTAVNPRLLSAPNITFTPYIGSATVQARKAMADSVWGNVARYLAGQQLEHEFVKAADGRL